MERTTNFSIGGKFFNISEQGYLKLKEYTDSIREYFSGYEDSDEIVNDIENRISEQFELITTNRNVLSESDVNNMIKTIGRIEDFEDSDEKVANTEKNKQTSKSKKLYRSEDDKILGGVVAGVAAYFGWSTLVLRILMIVLIPLLNGFIILLYVILWLIVPEAKTTSEKIEMHGDTITLSKIEDEIKSKLNSTNTENKQNLKKNLSYPFDLLRRLISRVVELTKKIGPAVLMLCGGLITLLSLLAITILSLVLGVLASTTSTPYINFSFVEAINITDYYSFLISTYGIILIPFVFLLLLGISAIRKKTMLSKSVVMGLLIIWFIGVVFTGVTVFALTPQIDVYLQSQRNDNSEVTKAINVTEFSKLNIQGYFDVNFIEGDEYKVQIQAAESEINNVVVSSNGQSLEIAKISNKQLCLFCVSKKATVLIEAPNIDSVSASGKINIVVSRLFGDEVTISLNGVTDAVIGSVTANFTTIKLSGTSALDLSGETEVLSLKSTGATKLNAFNFLVNDFEVNASGAAKININVEDSLEGRIYGASQIKYLGNPDISHIETSGSASVSKEIRKTGENEL